MAPPSNWSVLGGEEKDNESELAEDGLNFFYQKWYNHDSGRFEDPPPECFYDNSNVECHSCIRSALKEEVSPVTACLPACASPACLVQLY